MDLIGQATKLGAGKHHAVKNDDVFIDRLNHRYTVTMILVFAAIVSTQQYFGAPISCWVPAQFTGNYETYANNICWIMNTYYIPMDHDIPHAEPTRYEKMLKYYQWSPFILLFMAFCFYFPRMLWRSLNNKSGLDIEKLVDAALKQEQSDKDADREKHINHIVNAIRHYVENRYTSNSNFVSPRGAKKVAYAVSFWNHRHLSNYIVILFTFVKFLFLINSIVQILLLNNFLGNDYHVYGFEVLSKFAKGQNWIESKRFPRVTLCDFHIREIGIVHRYTVQCVLPINMFNEKIFLILWFWIVILFAFNLTDFFAWLIRIVRVGVRSNYVDRKLMLIRTKNTTNFDDIDDQSNRRDFVEKYLAADGCFALRLLARNGQDIVVGEVLERLFRHYCAEHRQKRLNTDQPMSHRNNGDQQGLMNSNE